MNERANVAGCFDRKGLIAAVEAGAAPEYLYFWGHTGNPGHAGPFVFSQWWEAPFVVDGVRYPTAEHYMMAEKARLFGDEAMGARIIEAATPAAAKALGREVAGFDQAVWAAHRFDIVVAGSVAKFGQDRALRAYLAATGDKVLVEAAPRDTIWGIGLGRDNPKAADPRTWRGLNLLGFALMKARAILKA